jgi:hypothetical protein
MMDCKSDSLLMDCGAGQTGTRAIFISDAAGSVTSPRRFVLRHHFCMTQYEGARSVAGWRDVQGSFLSIRGADDELGEEAPCHRAAPFEHAPRAWRDGLRGGATS